MHKYFDNLETKIGNKKFGKFLFNKYYNIKNLYWTLFYSISLSTLTGFGNAFPGLDLGISNILNLFIHGFINNMYLSFFLNIFYAKIVDRLSNGNHFRRNGYILWGIVVIIFFIWHNIIGTENLFQSNIAPAIISFILTRHHINVILRKNRKI